MSLFKTITGVLLVAVLAACGGGGGDAKTPVTVVATTTTTTSAVTVARLILAVQSGSAASITASGSSSTIVTVRALDASNALVKNAVIALSASGNAFLDNSTVVTDATTGLATVTLSADPADQISRTATLTASCTACTASVATLGVPIVGATLSVTPASPINMFKGGNTVALVAQVKDANNQALAGIPVVFASTNSATVAFGSQSTTVPTDITGIATINVLAIDVGIASVNVNAIGNVRQVAFTVAATNGILSVTSPATNTIELATSPATPVPITVSAPSATTVTFASTVGTFSNGLASITVPVVSGSAAANLSSTTGGTANISITDSLLRSTSLTLFFSLPVSSVNQVLLTANKTTVGLSTTGTPNFIRLTARAVNVSGANIQGVANVPISFSMSPVPNGGEYLTPALQFTDGSGFATANFYSGQQVTVQPITVTASVSSTVSATSNLSIGGSALSVAFGPASVIRSSVDNTLYIQDYAVQVTDSGGNPVPPTTVTLRVRPVAFSLGTRCTIANDATDAGKKATYCSEDVNANGSLDTGEDGVRYRTTVSTAGQCTDPVTAGLTPVTTGLPNGALSPVNTVGGSVPSTVQTDNNGTAAFSLTFLKASAIWVIDQITASVSTSGTESSTSTIFQLPSSEVDVKAPDICYLPDSPFLN